MRRHFPVAPLFSLLLLFFLVRCRSSSFQKFFSCKADLIVTISILTNVSHMAASSGSCMCLVVDSSTSSRESALLTWFLLSRNGSGGGGGGGGCIGEGVAVIRIFWYRHTLNIPCGLFPNIIWKTILRQIFSLTVNVYWNSFYRILTGNISDILLSILFKNNENFFDLELIIGGSMMENIERIRQT